MQTFAVCIRLRHDRFLTRFTCPRPSTARAPSARFEALGRERRLSPAAAMRAAAAESALRQQCRSWRAWRLREHALLRAPARRRSRRRSRGSHRSRSAVGCRRARRECRCMAVLRSAKRRAALAIALADIAGVWTLDEVTRALTDFADACVKGALRFALARSRRAMRSWPQRIGAELEADNRPRRAGDGQVRRVRTQLFQRHRSRRVLRRRALSLSQARRCARRRGRYRASGLVKLMSEITADGYVFRVDLRLRPDAGATQVAISTEAAEVLLRRHGPELGTRRHDQGARLRRRSGHRRALSSKAIEPFIWRRNLDYAAIEDIHSIKRQIHAHGGHGDDRGCGPQHQARARRHPRDRILRPDAAAHPGRAQSRAAPARHAGGASRRCARAGSCHDEAARRSDRGLPLPAHARAPPADDRGPADPHAARNRTKSLRMSPASWASRDAAAFGAALTQQLETVQGHYARLFERDSAARRRAKAISSSPAWKTIPKPSKRLQRMGFRDAAHVSAADPRLASRPHPRHAQRARPRAPDQAGARAARRARRRPPIPMRPSRSSTASSRNLPAGVQLFSLLLAQSGFAAL